MAQRAKWKTVLEEIHTDIILIGFLHQRRVWESFAPNDVEGRARQYAALRFPFDHSAEEHIPIWFISSQKKSLLLKTYLHVIHMTDLELFNCK
ncbi:hypothetical protein AVEN_203344-1 [Araneus ventricosus]|uniref:Uncharacterized protein n=1 Tax=Araneus ventricosus TaxID=182803 RepID=A0A4Y2NV54_ARAVE|nr:hypothetical protein AVEN_203344-1 [Araneus ventricosus]